jgi:hypothetical protein
MTQPTEAIMNEELVVWDAYDPVPTKWRTRKRISKIEQEAKVKGTAFEAAARDAQFQLEKGERLARSEALLRVKGTYDITNYASLRATQLNHSINQASQGNPRREQILRGFEDTAAITAGAIIYRYGADSR